MYSAFVHEGFNSLISYINYIFAKPNRTYVPCQRGQG